MEITVKEWELFTDAGKCPKGGKHILGEARKDDNNLVAYPVLTRFCAKCGEKLWLLEDIS